MFNLDANSPLRMTPAVDARLRANALRVLAMDAVQAANSGHPGMPMGMADIAEALWHRHLRHNPANPDWPDRDRFVLSNGHGSMLLYALLHLTGYTLTIDDLKQFRRLGSRTPGHPERGVTPGVETTTGPLGQGLANAVGMALAERELAATFNRPGFPIVDHFTYVFLGDGCLMEGISHEACSLAGTLGLGKLICLYDDNGISIDGSTRGWFTEDVPVRFEAYGWHVVRGIDGHDADAVDAAIRTAKAETQRPSLICCKTVIGCGSPNKAGHPDTHGAPLGDAEVAATRRALGWTHAPFFVPDAVRASWDARERGAALETRWRERLRAYAQAHPELVQEWRRRQAGALPQTWAQTIGTQLAAVSRSTAAIATRKASQNVLHAIGPVLPELIGGSADLTGSNLTDWKDMRTLGATTSGNYVHFGVREFGMAALLNGIAVHGGFIAYGGTFLVFSDYARNALRMAALMRLGAIFVFTHDSIGLGEDGPTHQPIEHAASLRLIPNMHVWRPCDALETAVAWQAAIERRDGPSCLLLSRQNLPIVSTQADRNRLAARGGYVLSESVVAPPSVVLIACGSEVSLAIAAQSLLEQEGIGTRVVSMPSTSVFDRQDDAYQRRVLPSDLPRIVIEAGAPDCWYRYVRGNGEVLGLSRFGESAPGAELFAHFDLTPEAIAHAARRNLHSHAH